MSRNFFEEEVIGAEYGHQLRHFGEKYDSISQKFSKTSEFSDQLKTLLQNLIFNPFSRYHVISYWNPIQLFEATYPLCHVMFICYVDYNEKKEKRLNMHLTQLSEDDFKIEGYNPHPYLPTEPAV
jgi:thymidylate synthase